jgi:hypothetical protein
MVFSTGYIERLREEIPILDEGIWECWRGILGKHWAPVGRPTI